MSTPLNKIYNRFPIALQNFVVTLKGIGIHNERYGKIFKSNLSLLRKTQWLSKGQLDELQCQLLQALILHAASNVPYYRRVFQSHGIAIKDIQTPDDLKKIPLLTKDDIRKNFKDLISDDAKARGLRLAHTSGTTGTPLEFYWDKKVIYMTNAALWRQREWAGIKVGDPFVLMTGNVIVPLHQKKPPFWRYNLVQNQLLVSSFHLNAQNMKSIVQKLKAFKPAFLEAYPSTAYILGRYLVERNETVPLRAVFVSSEPLYASHREIIEKAFGCHVFDYLGMAERVIFATQCEKCEGHHLNSEYGITEIISQNGNGANADISGNIVATGLHNFAMPLIRYQTGDKSALLSSNCSCGRQLPLMQDVVTKSESIIRTPDGRYISPSVLTHPFKPLRGIRESQIIQEDIYHLRIKLVKEKEGIEIKVDQLVQEMKQRIGEEMKVDVEFVDAIPRTSAGKFQWVISKVS